MDKPFALRDRIKITDPSFQALVGTYAYLFEISDGYYYAYAERRDSRHMQVPPSIALTADMFKHAPKPRVVPEHIVKQLDMQLSVQPVIPKGFKLTLVGNKSTPLVP